MAENRDISIEDGREPSTFFRLVTDQQASYFSTKNSNETDVNETTAPTSPIALAVSSQHTRSKTFPDFPSCKSRGEKGASCISSRQSSGSDSSNDHSISSEGLRGERTDNTSKQRRRSNSSDLSPTVPPLPLAANRHRSFLSCTTPQIKFLLSDENAGKFIGKSRSAINRLELSTRCRVVPSRSNDFFPGTTDRTCLVYSDTLDDVLHAVSFILEHLSEIGEGISSENKNEITAKILLPNSACGLIIGRGGAKIRSLSSATNTKIDISSPIITGSTASHSAAVQVGVFSPDLQRPVAITGTITGCTKCICEILSAIFCDNITNTTSGILEQELSRKKSLDEKKPKASTNEIPQASYKEVLNRQQLGEFISTEEERINEPVEGCSIKKDTNTSYTTLNDDDLSSCGLRDLVAHKCCKHVDIGAAVMPCLLFDENAKDGYVYVDTVPANNSTRYAEVLNREFNAVVIEHHLKWSPLCETLPGPMFFGKESCTRVGRYDFHHCDLIVDWCLERNIKVKGHVLVWHVTSPEFLNDYTPEVLREQLRRHIYTVVGHFRGRIHCWDVVNEALAPDGSLAKNIFHEKLGPSYIDDAFRWAHDADPKAFLIYNDNKVEGCGLLPEVRSLKADAFYNLLKGMKERGIPVHGAGMQAHFNAAGTGLSLPPTPRSVKAQIRRLGNLGLRVNLSEMDVRVGNISSKELQQTAQRQIYHDIIAAALTEPAFEGVYFWGVSDRHTWVSDFYANESGDKPTPLLFDSEYNKKQCSYGAVRDALNTMTVGGRIGGDVLLDSDNYDNGRPWGFEWISTEISDYANDNNTAGESRPDWLQV
eukprot:CAMPEP_0172433592 /NCGR_PEP_ID=MMETSP1064-20121228/68901_1 /TAXON_ID=202472 /ORGANISM="Aulacoseira subarctica , Strain CCAP 1002/5" /LENGTH=822 /DNA_ID=CAMNT_0013181615 /DNA_START=43 /DNA_END=2511 /DNA_ORIENTATION=-